MSEITTDNADEFFARVFLVERVHGSLLKTDDGEKIISLFITKAEVVSHIGLSTNEDEKNERVFLRLLFKSAIEKSKRNELT